MLSLSAAASAQTLSGDALIDALEGGGYVIVMRHTSSPREQPGPRETVPGNVDGERQLDEYGRATASAMGYAFREIELPVGDVFSSPAFRATETAHYFGIGDMHEVAGLGEDNDADWLRMKAAEAPAAGTNTIVITHAPNLTSAFGDDAEGLEAGGALLFKPGDGEPEIVAKLPIEEWARLAVD